ncbi:hypothetical protein HOB10_04330 [Candidatus Parcubacteria bacterium]|jgi:hypothetical protein|nr:hypothetical protein [Candidatus Parcubacteria bacterium]
MMTVRLSKRGKFLGMEGTVDGIISLSRYGGDNAVSAIFYTPPGSKVAQTVLTISYDNSGQGTQEVSTIFPEEASNKVRLVIG